MTRRFGQAREGVLWLGVVITLLGGLGACGDDDGEGAPNGTGGASTGGTEPGSGGAVGMGGSKVSGGSSGAPPKGGSGGSSGGSSGASTGGASAGGIPANAGESGTPGEGGTAPVAGSPGGGSAGDAGAGASGGSDAGSGGAAEVSVEYRSCERGAAITRVELYRIDRAQQTCTLVVVQQGLLNCLEGLKSEGWCVIGAAISNDVEACEAFETPSDPVQATAGEGSFTISTQRLALDIAVTFEFPASSGLPESVSVEADDCLADCMMNDCRP